MGLGWDCERINIESSRVGWIIGRVREHANNANRDSRRF